MALLSLLQGCSNKLDAYSLIYSSKTGFFKKVFLIYSWKILF